MLLERNTSGTIPSDSQGATPLHYGAQSNNAVRTSYCPRLMCLYLKEKEIERTLTLSCLRLIVNLSYHLTLHRNMSL